MRDRILESIFLDTTLWANSIAHGVDKHIAHTYLEKLADPHVRAELCVKIAEGRYKIQPPHTGYRKKDDGGERMFLANEPMDRLILNIIYKWLMKNESVRIHHSCKSYQTGIGIGNIVKQIAGHISKQPNQYSGTIVGRKFDIHKYFETIERKYIHNALSAIEKDFGESSVIDLLRDYYDTDIYYDTRKHEYVNSYQGIKQGCAVSSWLANVLLYSLDDELSQRGGLYVRYSDDILYIGDDYNDVTTIIRERLSQIGLKLNEQKVSDISANDYFKFLGYEIHGSDITLSHKWVKSFEHEINQRTIHNVPLIQKVRRIRKENGNDCEKQLNNILAKTTRNVERYLLYGDGNYSWATEVLPTVNNTRDLLQLTSYSLDALRAVYTGHTHIGGLGKSLKHGIQRGKGRNVKSNRLATQHLEIRHGKDSYVDHFISLFAAQKTISNKWLFRTLSVNMVNTHKHKMYGQTDPTNMQDIFREEMIAQIEALYETFLYSQPNGNSFERFYAYSIDDISMDQLIEGTNRDEALLHLEQYLVEKVNFSKLQETPGEWYWQSKKLPQLVLLKEWFKTYDITTIATDR